jgi:hypothetical protein
MSAGAAWLVLSGHEHDLQRFHRRDGITQYVAGAGGSVKPRPRRDRRLAFVRSGVTGGLRIKLEPGIARLEFHSAGGRLLDRSRVTCRPEGAQPERARATGLEPATTGVTGRADASDAGWTDGDKCAGCLWMRCPSWRNPREGLGASLRDVRAWPRRRPIR